MRCVKAECVNPVNGELTEKDFSVVYRSCDGKRRRDTTCKKCRLAMKKARKAARAEEGEKPIVTDWTEFDKEPWAVRFANDVIRTMRLTA